MNANAYQEFTRTTAIYPKDIEIPYLALGLAGEAGEVANKVKKILRDENGVLTEEKKVEIRKELGDAIWYLARLLDAVGVKFEDALEENFQKLSSRKARGVLSGSGDNR